MRNEMLLRRNSVKNEKLVVIFPTGEIIELANPNGYVAIGNDLDNIRANPSPYERLNLELDVSGDSLISIMPGPHGGIKGYMRYKEKERKRKLKEGRK